MGRKKKQEDICSVCVDLTTSRENPLLTCNSCGIMVHGGCYGVTQLSVSGWKCQACEHMGEANKTSCQLCCGLGGAMKMTDMEGWSHIICALFIPEGRFGDENKMEPILISVIPAERFGKICYVCAASKGKLDNARRGACIQCAAPKCSRYFHVTCGQKQGLLCEDSLLQDSLPSVGYCLWHMMKLPVDSHRKRLPAYSPNLLVPKDKRAADVRIGARGDENSVEQKMKKRQGIIVEPDKETSEGRGDEKNVKKVVDVGPRRSKRLKTTIENDLEMIAMGTDHSQSPVTVKKLRPRKSVRNSDRASVPGPVSHRTDNQMHRSSVGVKRRLFNSPHVVHESQVQEMTDDNNEIATNSVTISVEYFYENGSLEQHLIPDIKARSLRSETPESTSLLAIEHECSSQYLVNSAHGPLDSTLFVETSTVTLAESASQQSKNDSCKSHEGRKLFTSEKFSHENTSAIRHDRSTRVRRLIEEAGLRQGLGLRSHFQVPSDRERMEILEQLFEVQNGRRIIYLERKEGSSLVKQSHSVNLFADGELDEM